eukprot:Opistho-2@51936
MKLWMCHQNENRRGRGKGRGRGRGRGSAASPPRDQVLTLPWDRPLFINPRDYVPDYMSEEDMILKAKRITMIQLLPTVKYTNKLGVPKRHRECIICCDDYMEGDLLLGLPCNHFAHHECLSDWLNRSFMCPMCMYELDLESIEKTHWPALNEHAWSGASSSSSLAMAKGKGAVSAEVLPVAVSRSHSQGIPLDSL